MAKQAKNIFICSECGYESSKWNGRCPECDAWNSFIETEAAVPVKSSGKASGAVLSAGVKAETFTLKEVSKTADIRFDTGVKELNRVLGGGLVKGSLVLLSGEPGIGKSTLLLQICGSLTSAPQKNVQKSLQKNLNVLYISGEESLRQIKLRAERLSVTSDSLKLASCNDADIAAETIISSKPDAVIIDSIQTMHTETANGTSGSIAQVRECTNIFCRTAKAYDIPIFIVGHVNKDGGIAGPKVMEHIVDTVLMFEGDKQYTYRILRAAKNRFGSTNEIGVFEMTGRGLEEVPNPSKSLLEGRAGEISGNCVACVMEGSRPLLTEVQSLVTKTMSNYPQRIATGLPLSRLAILLAVLEKRAGMFLSRLDVFVNIIGGIRLDEPAGDLPLALAIASAVFDTPIFETTASFGEVGLGGEIRSVPAAESRIREIARLGFKRCIVPKGCIKDTQIMTAIAKEYPDLEIIGVSRITEVMKIFHRA
jgi:DNA repair protein RadA/Sms